VKLTDPALHPVFLAFLLDEGGAGWVEWGAAKLRSFVGPCSQGNWNKIQGAKTVRCSHAAFDDFRVFSHVVQALNGRTPNFLLLEPPSIPELVGGAQMVMLLALHTDKQFAPEVYRYAAAVSDLHGAGTLPEPLKKSSEYVKVPIRAPGLREEAAEYVGKLNRVLIAQMEAHGG